MIGTIALIIDLLLYYYSGESCFIQKFNILRSIKIFFEVKVKVSLLEYINRKYI